MSFPKNQKIKGIRQMNQIDDEVNNENNKVNNKNNKEQNNNKITNEENEEEEEDEDEEEEESSNTNEGNDGNNDNDGDNDDDNENEEEEEDNEDNLSILESYKYKLNYIDDIQLYPRPKTNFIIYKNSKKNNTFISNPNNNELIPSVRAYFNNIEELNSSIKLIRPSQYIIPYNFSKLQKGLNLFGINVEPFSMDEKQNTIEFIQKIKVNIKNKYNNKILKCKHCNAIYHKLNCNYEMITNHGIYQTNKIHCFICKNYTNFYILDSISHNNFDKYINPEEIFMVPNMEYDKPSIEYIIKDQNDNNDSLERITIQIIVLDMSNKNFFNYIYNILINILSTENNENNMYTCNENIKNKFKYILIAYDINKVYFVHFNNNINKTINIIIMNDLKNPFCPVDPKKLIYNKNDFIELLENFYNSFVLTKIYNKNIDEKSFIFYDINNSIIKSIFNLIKINKINENIHKNIINYYHLIFLSSFNHNIDTTILEQNKIYNIFLSFFLILNKSNKNIPFINNLNAANSKLYYYPIIYDEPADIEQKYQKINNDLILLLSNYENYIYELKMNICYDKNLFKNHFNNNYIYISFYPNKMQFNKLYILPQYKKPNLKDTVYIQYNIEYYNLIDNNKHIRVLSFMSKISDNQIDIFNAYDEEVLFRTVLVYHINELNFNKNNFASINKLFIDISNKKDLLFSKLIKDIEIRIKIHCAKNYRFGEEKNNIFKPLSCKCFPLYFFSFVKQISNGDNLNLLNLLYDSPITIFMKNIYPTLLSLGYKLKKTKEEVFYLHPLTALYLERNQLLLLDDGIYITLLINNEINKRKKEHYFKIFDEKNKVFSFNVESPILIDIIKNKPIKAIYLDNETILNKKILGIFLEDIIIKNINDDNPHIKLFENTNEYIQNDINYPNYYELLTGKIFEYLE